jgi:hypothetical protein
MAKINFGYLTLFFYLRRKISPLNTIYEKFFAQDNRVSTFLSMSEYYDLNNMEQPSPAKIHLIGPFQVFKDMGKDILDTVKPYKGFYQSTRDFLQPAIGILNIVKGGVSIVLSPLVMLGIFAMDCVQAVYASVATNKSGSSIRSAFAHNCLINVMGIASWITDGITSVIRGTTQVVTTPLTWFVKMPLRGLITAIKGVPKIEENPGIQKLLNHSLSTVVASTDNEGFGYRSGGSELIQKALHAKFKCSLSKGQHTDINPNEEENKYRNDSAAYFQMFTLPNKKPASNDNENAPLIATDETSKYSEAEVKGKFFSLRS